jgi:MoaA/NifB/PqqE/SkfB family radical SAM enzyme
MSGSFARTLDAVRWANAIGLSVQINTTFSRRNIAEIDAIVALIESLNITLWSVFFLVPTGRGRLDDLLNADEFEQVFAKIYGLSKTASFDIKPPRRSTTDDLCCSRESPNVRLASKLTQSRTRPLMTLGGRRAA